MKKIRLDKLLADLNVATRSEAKKIIRKGHIKVNNTVCRNPSTIITDQDTILYDDKILEIPEDFVYYFFYKPKGVILERKTKTSYQSFEDYISEIIYKDKLQPAGSLSVNSEGLVILTNDGSFIHKITKPEVEKEYIIETEKPFTKEQLIAISSGFKLLDGTVSPPLKILPFTETTYSVIFRGHNIAHLIQKIAKTFDNYLLTQKRVRIGNLELPQNLKPGELKKIDFSAIKNFV